MVDYRSKFLPETVRTRTGASLTNVYQTLGSPITNPSRCLIFVNNTGVLLAISWDGANDHLILVAGATVVLDQTSNAVAGAPLVTHALTQFSVRAPAGAAGTDSVYLSTFYAS